MVNATPEESYFCPYGHVPHVHAPLDADGDAARGKVPGLSVHGNDDEKAEQCHRALDDTNLFFLFLNLIPYQQNI